LSAAFRNLDRAAQDDLTRRYEELCVHYVMLPDRVRARWHISMSGKCFEPDELEQRAAEKRARELDRAFFRR
jgi:hypothetical protein